MMTLTYFAMRTGTGTLLCLFLCVLRVLCCCCCFRSFLPVGALAREEVLREDVVMCLLPLLHEAPLCCFLLLTTSA